jgi:cytochrome c-type biogenesis protein CcsB
MIQAKERTALARRTARVVQRVAVLAVAAVLSAAASGSALASNWADPAAVSAVGAMAIQHDGRVMPVDTFARESVKAVTGRRAWKDEDPVLTVLGWTFDPDRAANEPLVKLGHADFAAACGLPAGTRYASFAQIVNNPAAMDLLRRAHAEAEADRPVKGVLADAAKLEERLVTMQGFLRGQAWTVVPDTQDRSAAWGVPPLRSVDALVTVAGVRPAGVPAAAALEREITYNAVRPTRVAWIVLALSLLVSIAASVRFNPWLDRVALAGLAVGFGVMTWGIATRWVVAGRIPAANMYESLLFLAWGVGAFALIAFAVLKNRLVVVNATAMSALTMALTDLLPIDGFIHPVAPVLSGTPWLAIHVPIIMVSYSVLALGVVIAHMQIGLTIFKPARRELIARMNDLLYWYAHVGSILLIAGIITGSIWASSSWGRYWGWDPKEVWSLVAFLAYIAILHGRVDRFIGPFGVAAISIIAFQTILMTYLGVNFALTTGMHSYGFGDSPVVGWMALVALLEGVFLLVGLIAHKRSARGRPGLVAA